MPETVKLSIALRSPKKDTVESAKVEVSQDAQGGSCLVHDGKKIGLVLRVSTNYTAPNDMVCIRVHTPPAGNNWGDGGTELDYSSARTRAAAAKVAFETIANTLLVVSFQATG